MKVYKSFLVNDNCIDSVHLPLFSIVIMVNTTASIMQGNNSKKSDKIDRIVSNHLSNCNMHQLKIITNYRF